jgi:hypothetical protein
MFPHKDRSENLMCLDITRICLDGGLYLSLGFVVTPDLQKAQRVVVGIGAWPGRSLTAFWEIIERLVCVAADRHHLAQEIVRRGVVGIES